MTTQQHYIARVEALSVPNVVTHRRLVVECACGWRSAVHVDPARARTDGAQHLKEAP